MPLSFIPYSWLPCIIGIIMAIIMNIMSIGSIEETKEVIDFCAKNNIVADVEVIPIQKINDAYERMLKGDVKYRFVIDMASLK